MEKERNDLNKGNRRLTFVAFVVYIQMFFVGLLFSASVYAKEPVSVGVVNVTFLMENAPQSDIASNQLKEKFLPQEKKLADELEKINKLEAELKKIVASNSDTSLKRQKERELRSRKRARSRMLQDFREELRFARDAALDVVQKEVFSAIDDVRKQQDIDIVLQDYISASRKVDITPLVLEYLKKKLDNFSKTEADSATGKN